MLPNYARNQDGVVYQVDREPFTYDTQYVIDRYDTYGVLNEWMSFLRLGYVIGSIGGVPQSILDIGYGNGAFLKTASRLIPTCYGYDVSGYPLPPGVTFAEDWLHTPVNVVTFFDCLEHFEDPYIIQQLPTKYVVLSLPWFHDLSDAWFATWKHRRPNEHLWFFNPTSLSAFAEQAGYTLLQTSWLEDSVRMPLGLRDEPGASALPNILTATLRKTRL